MRSSLVSRLTGPLLLAAVWLGCASLDAADAVFHIHPVSEAQAAEYKLGTNFFKKATLVQNILIATSAKVSDVTILEAAYQFDMVMKTIRPEIAQRIRDKQVLCVLVGLPEYCPAVETGIGPDALHYIRPPLPLLDLRNFVMQEHPTEIVLQLHF